MSALQRPYISSTFSPCCCPYCARYEEGANVEDPSVLTQVGEALGLPGAAAYVADPQAGAQEVEEEDREAKWR